jgi:hypothetical protein
LSLLAGRTSTIRIGTAGVLLSEGKWAPCIELSRGG